MVVTVLYVESCQVILASMLAAPEVGPVIRARDCYVLSVNNQVQGRGISGESACHCEIRLANHDSPTGEWGGTILIGLRCF